jgi:hypothetical protein
MTGDLARLREFEAMSEEGRNEAIKQMAAAFSADVIAQIISENARIEDGKIANVGYLAVKIAEALEPTP